MLKLKPHPSSPASAPVEEQRQSTRFLKEPDTEFAVIQVERGLEILAEVRDESLLGLGLLVAELGGLEIGQEVTVVYRREVLDAIVRHATPRPNGTFHVGFECRKSRSHGPRGT